MEKEKLIQFIKNEDVFLIKEINPKDIVIDEKIRGYCEKNRCGNYGNNFMCPPAIGSVNDFMQKMENYNICFIIGIKDKNVNLKSEEVYKSKNKLNRILLEIEQEAGRLGFFNAKVLIAGNCNICNPCKKALGYKSCPYPKMSRPSPEALGVDVFKTLEDIGYKLEFKDDEVTWIGMLLI